MTASFRIAFLKVVPQILLGNSNISLVKNQITAVTHRPPFSLNIHVRRL